MKDKDLLKAVILETLDIDLSDQECKRILASRSRPAESGARMDKNTPPCSKRFSQPFDRLTRKLRFP